MLAAIGNRMRSWQVVANVSFISGKNAAYEFGCNSCLKRMLHSKFSSERSSGQQRQ